MHFVFIGPEGSGKGTQAKLLSEKLQIPHLVSGDLVRKYAKEDTGLIGDICREALSTGRYVADSEMYVLWKQRLKEDDTKKGWVIDGFPRNLSQATFLERKIEKYGQNLDSVFYLNVPEADLLTRLKKRGRRNPDGSLHDSPERIRERLKHYTLGKEEVLNYYRKRGILEEIDGTGDIDTIHQDILKRVHSKNSIRD